MSRQRHFSRSSNRGGPRESRKAAELFESATRLRAARTDDLNAVLCDVYAVIHSELNFGESLTCILARSAIALHCPTAVIAFRTSDGWVIQHVHGYPSNLVGTRISAIDDRTTLLAIQTRAPVAISDTFIDDRMDHEQLQQDDIRSALTVPLRVGPEIVGVILYTYRNKPFSFQPAHIEFAEGLSAAISLKLENASLQQRSEAATARRAEAETALEVAEKQFRNMFRTTRVGMAEADPFTLRLQRVTDTFAEMTGFTPEELTSKNLLELTPGEERKTNWECYSRLVLQEFSNYEIEKRLVRKDGSIFWSYMILTLIRDRENQPLRTVAIIKNISERKHAEEALKENEKRLWLALDATKLGLWEWHFASHKIFFSDTACAISGFNREGNFASVDDMRKLVHPEDVEVIRIVNRSLIENKPFEAEYRIVRPDGSVRWVSNHGRIDHDPAGVPIRMIGTLADITERKDAERALREAQNRLQGYTRDLENAVAERTAELREMISDLHQVSYAMIHDMRAPLRAMRGFAELLTEMSDERTPSKVREFQRRIIVAAARLDKMIIDALNFTRVLHEQLPMEPVDLHKLLLGLMETYPKLQPSLADIQIDGELPSVLGNESLLTQCFSNLLSNAVKFVAPGTRPRIRIYAQTVSDRDRSNEKSASGLPPHGLNEAVSPAETASAPMEGSKSAQKHYVRISIEDNGVGIPPQVRDRVFGIFQRFSTHQEGTGIGLAIARKATERMGGTVGFESEPGRGSRFWVELPKADEYKPETGSGREL